MAGNEIFSKEVYAKPPGTNYATSTIDVNYIEFTWSMDLGNLNDYGPKSTKNYRYTSVVIDKFSKICWTVLSKNEDAK